ncbi:MAG: hypothetical protein KG029_04235 [Bacteroidetes bacterium]|nr:hypothetical protein [Bacteroidota bacterium]
MNRPDNILIQHIESFIKKYFKNKLFRGLIFFTLLITSVFLFFNFIEYVAYLPEIARMVIFYGFLLLFVTVFILNIAYPGIKLIRYRNSMSVREAALIIGKHFPDVSDKLLNTLQLSEYYANESKENKFLLAAIKQKTEKLSVVPFAAAVDLKGNLKYVKIAAIPVFIFVFSLLLFPSFVKNPAQRIVMYNTHFSKPLPFEVSIRNQDLSVMQNEDFELTINLEGVEIPSQFYIESNKTKFLMERTSTTEFRYVFRKVGQEINFNIIGGDFRSNRLNLIVHPKPLLLAYEAELNYPAYTGRSKETIKDQSWLSVPVGTLIQWRFFTRDTENISLLIDSLSVEAANDKNSWSYEQLVLQNSNISVTPSNKFSYASSGMNLTVDVINDEYPTISVNQVDDILLNKNKYYTGLIGDDYGFSRLSVKLEVVPDKKEEARMTSTFDLAFDPQNLRQQFFHFLNLDSLETYPGETLKVQFAVYDNDRFSGPKMRLSQVFEHKFASSETLDSISKSTQDEVNKRMEKALKEAQEIRKDLSDLNRKLMLKKEIDWNDRQSVNKLMQKQQSLESELEQLKKERESLNQFNRENELANDRILEKQAMIDKLMEEIIPDDIRKMMEELEKLLDELNKDQITDMLKKMEMNNDQLEKMLDRNLSLLKQLQVEKEMNALMDRLEKLSDELEKNAKETEAKSKEKEELSKNLEDIQEKFEKEMNALDSLRKENKSLERPFKLDDTKSDENQISDEMEGGQQELQKNKNKESSKKQQSGADKMKDLKDKLNMMMQMSSQQQMAEDANALRFLLENVLRISLSQEDLMLNLTVMRRDDPAYVDIIKKQSIISESFRVVEDSLTALSKRQPMIQNFIFEEVNAVKNRVGEAQDFMKDRITGNAANSQQFSMMALNNLALMLSEALKNMQDSMGMPSPMQGEGQCKDGQSSGEGLQNMRQMQEALGKQLKDAMEGKSGNKGKSGMSEEIARMAAQQEAIRQQLKNMIDQMKSEGSLGDGGLNETLLEMEKFEEQLVNKQLNEQLLERQNDIVVRLLESEKAQKERDKEERRESNEFKGENLGNLGENIEYKRLLENQRDVLRVNPVDLHPYYKQKVNQYFIRSNVASVYEEDNKNY